MTRTFINLTLLLILASGCKHKKQPDIFSQNITDSVKSETITESIKIFDKSYTEHDLESKTPEFLRYARNEIFAKQGYIFSDSCLNTFFSQQDWYKGKSNSISLSEKEKEWVNKIKTLEEEYNQEPPCKVITKYNFNGYPLYYVAYNLRDRGNDRIEYSSAELFLLDSSWIWMLECNTIPPEIIISESIEKIYCKDAGSVIDPKEFSLVNFDSSCIGGEYKELKIRLYGPSSDDEHWIIGFDSKGHLAKLISGVWLRYERKDSDSTIKFTSFDRCDRIGTEFCDNEYIFNTITRQVRKITKEKYQHRILKNTLSDSVKVFATKAAAYSHYLESVKFVVPPNTEVYISHFLDEKHVLLVEYKADSGWISYDDLHGFNISFAD